MFRLLILVWQRMAFNSLVSGDYQKAEKYFRRIHRYKSSDGGFEYNMGLIKLAQCDFEEAEVFFKKDLDLYGESFNRSRVMGDLYYIWGQRDKAGDWYKKSIADCTTAVDRNILKMRIQKCNSEKVFNDVRKSHISFNMGNQLVKEKKYEEGLVAFSNAVEQDNTNFQALNNKGSILMNHFHNYRDSLVCFEKALNYSSLPAISINVNKAREAIKKGNKDE